MQDDDTNIYNIQAEQALLGTLLTDNNQVNKVDFIQAEHFYEAVHGRIFEAIVKNTNQGLPADPVILKTEFHDDADLVEYGRAKYLAKIAGMSVGVLDIRGYAELVFELARKRAYGEAINAAHQDFTKNGATLDLETELNGLTDKFLDFSLKTKKFEALNGHKVYQGIIEKMQLEEDVFYSTGIECLDKSLNGGLSPETTMAIGGDTGQGKTMLLGTIAFNMAEADIPVLYIAAEMGAEQLHQRHIARRIGENAIGFKVKRNCPDFQAKVIAGLADENKNLIYQDAPGITFSDLKRLVISNVRRYGCKGVFVDYIQLIQGCPPRTSQASHQESVAQWLADVAKQESIFSAYAAQVNAEEAFRGGGIKYSGDYNYIIKKMGDPNDAKREAAYLIQTKSRHALAKDIGDEHSPSLSFASTGSHLLDYDMPYHMREEIEI